jgi:hypothetical protein
MGPEWTRFPIARLRYAKATRQWAVYWRDRHLRFHLYDRIASSPRIDDLLQETDRDPAAIFWGIGPEPQASPAKRTPLPPQMSVLHLLVSSGLWPCVAARLRAGRNLVARQEPLDRLVDERVIGEPTGRHGAWRGQVG